MDNYYTQTRPSILGYCGGQSDDPKDWDCEFLVAGLEGDTRFRVMDNRYLDSILDQGADVYRSLWSRRGSLFFLDLEYTNERDHEEIYRDGLKIFHNGLEPVYQRLCRRLDSFGVSYLTVMTATGYHFVFRVPFETEAHKDLEQLGHPCSQLLEQYARISAMSQRDRLVPEKCARAFDALGRLAEYLSAEVESDSDLPVAIGKLFDRQIILDLSTYADPLHLRFLRCVGSYHQKSSDRYATMIRRPDHGEQRTLEDCLVLYASPEEAASAIRAQPAEIPSAGEGLNDLIEAYRQSDLKRRHQAFDEHQTSGKELEKARSLLMRYRDGELATDLGLKRALLEGGRREIHPAAVGLAAGERLEQGDWEAAIMTWAKENEDGYNPFSRALFWARVYGS